MAKPKTMGGVISFRLRVHEDAELRRRAAEKGKTPGAYVRERIERALRGEQGKIPTAGTTRTAAVANEGSHRHGKLRVLGWGGWICTCGAISTDRGRSWGVSPPP